MDQKQLDQEKQLAAIRSLEFVKNGMTVGLGTGSTSAHMIRGLGEKIREGLSIKAVASSESSAQLAENLGITLVNPDQAGLLDIYIDGADEFDDQFRMIKGGGGALLREKILAYNAKFIVIIADSSKKVDKLGQFKLPVEIIKFAREGILRKLSVMKLKPAVRVSGNEPFKTDENNLIIDVDISAQDDLEILNQQLLEIPGIVETGLFLNLVNVIIYTKGDKTFLLEYEGRMSG